MTARKKSAPGHGPTVAVVSLGCAKNTVDSEVLLGRLAAASFVPVRDPAEAEIVVVNTCGFIEAAKKESIDAILQATRLRKGGRMRTLAVGGCLAQRYGQELRKELPEIDVLFGLDDVERLADRLMERETDRVASSSVATFAPATYLYGASSPRLLSTPGHYAYVKISEGCDLPCAFCAIPKIRGRYRSRPPEDIEREVRVLADRGIREICLVAQDSTWWGADLYGRPRLPELMKRLSAVEGPAWLRLHYLYPTRVGQDLLDAMAHPRVAPYFDIPLQHASDRILRSMQRIGGRREIEATLARIRKTFPLAALRSTFIVGYPGETERDFSELLGFLEGARLDYAGFFAFSPEEGTPAGERPDQVPEGAKRERLAAAYRAQERIAESAHQRWVGRKLTAVVEEANPHGATARTAYQAPEVDGVVQLEAPGATSVGRAGGKPGRGRRGKPWKPGDWLEIEITHALAQDLAGQACD